MKFVRLDLRAFGPFTERPLDLSAGDEGFHLVYGENEAGKTSALRALRQLLYGIPGNSSDDFVHKYSAMRIGATLARRDGTRLEFVRRKGNKGTLLAADEKTALDDSVLRAFLGGCDENQFKTMFGIDHQALVEGGKDIVQGKGEIGHVLFAAGAGIAGLRTIRESLETQAEGLFKPGGKNPVLNQSLSALKEAKQKIRDSALPSSEWQKHQTALADTTAKLADVEDKIGQLSRQKARLTRLQGALPAIGRLRQLNAQLAARGDVPVLADDFAELRRQTLAELDTAGRTQGEAAAECGRIEADIDRLAVPEALLARAKEIEEFSGELGAYRKGQKDLPGLVATRAQLEKNAAEILHELRPDLSPLSHFGRGAGGEGDKGDSIATLAEQLRLSRRQQVEIQNLGNRQKALEEAIKQARRETGDTDRRLKEATGQLEKLPPSQDPAALGEAVRQARGQGNLDAQAAALREEIDALQRQAGIDLGKLGLWAGPLDELEKLAVPSPETIARFDRDMADAQATVRQLQTELEKAKAEAAEIETTQEKLRLEGDVPSEADLSEARRTRDSGWRLVLGRWREGKADEESERRFLDAAGESDLATGYERTVRQADDVSDRLRREANRVANRASLDARRLAVEKRTSELTDQFSAAEERLHGIGEVWQDAWKPAEIAPLPPREMQGWMQRQQAIVVKAQTIRQRTAALTQIDGRIAAHCRQLQACLGEFEEAGKDTAALDALLARAEAVVKRIEAAAETRRQLDREAARLTKDLATARTKAQEADEEMAAWKSQWSAAIAPLGLSAETVPAAVNEVVAQTNELFSHLKEAAGIIVRIEGIGREAQTFQQKAARLLEATGQLPADESQLEEALEGLFRRLRQAQADQKKLDLLQSQLKKQSERRQAAQAAAQDAEARLAVLCREAACQSPDELPAVERASAEVAVLRQKREECFEELLQLAAGATVKALLAEAETVSADALPGELEKVAGELADLERDRLGLRETLGGEKAEVARMDAGAAAADAAEEAQEILARIEPDVRHYLRLRLATAVLREGIDRYRKKNEGPVLARASELFSRLTLGSFEGLRIDFEDDQQALAGVRPGGATLLPTAMSEGACDQLYLALRLASLETWLERNEPMPFIVDDILVSFDNRRAAATLEVLAELSRRTQVIFFAHHEHLVELAKESVPEDVLFVHKL